MRLAVISVNDHHFHPSRRLKQAARSRGHDLRVINPYHLVPVLDENGPSFDGMDQPPDLIFPRQGSPMGDYGFVLLNHFERMGVLLANGVAGITLAKNQFKTLQALKEAAIPIPETCFITRPDKFFNAVDRLGGYPLVAKQVDGMGGDGVAKIDHKGMAETYLKEQLNPAKGVLLQTFLPPEQRKDIRVLVIGEKAAAGMALTPKSNDFRANIHQSGHAKGILNIPEQWAECAVAAARACKLVIAGVDMMIDRTGSPLVIEVNYSPGFRGLEAATGKDIALEMILFAEKTVRHHINRF